MPPAAVCRPAAAWSTISCLTTKAGRGSLCEPLEEKEPHGHGTDGRGCPSPCSHGSGLRYSLPSSETELRQGSAQVKQHNGQIAIRQPNLKACACWQLAAWTMDRTAAA
ncbi:hypothetical protein PAHAL_3G025600 [Panicum hallii]|uniref:Uncharacterized protein n=1 Tax=Panicum hallii TaxID=206008 RepID=A0A2T8KGU8_9POAL|nr:hypothetical protein PAHAL_3G025600 [Panicum hallii]